MAGFGSDPFGLSPFGLADSGGSGGGGFGTGPFGISPFGTGGGGSPPVSSPVAATGSLHRWAAFARTAGYAPSVHLPILQVSGVLAHMGVSRAVLKTGYTPERWDALAAPGGLILYRDDRQLFTGRVQRRQLTWDQSGDAQIQVDCVGEEQHLANRLVMPDPLRAGNDQTVNDYWTFTGRASTAMWQLISDQAGPTCRTARQVPGLVMGADPGAGPSRTWQGLFNDAGPNGVLDKLAQISAASGADLGLRFTSTAGTLTVDVVAPRDLTAAAQFSADLRNLVAFDYSEQAPTVTNALVAGQGDLHLRTRSLQITTDPATLAWGVQSWSYIDRRDTADTTELAQAGLDELAQGGPTINLQTTLTDTQAATWRVDWDLGDRVTVRVGLPGQVKPAVVADLVRQISFDVGADGAEQIQPVIGSYDAKAIRPTPTQRQLAVVGSTLAGLISRK